MGEPLSSQLSDEAMRQSGELQRRLVEMMRAATALEQRALADAYKVEVLRANAREVEALQLALDNEQAKGVHTCSVHCERPLCVMTRRAEAAEADARRYSFLAHKCNHGDEHGATEIRFSSAAPPDAAIDAAIARGGEDA